MNSQKYELAFISDDNLYNHVKQTIETYRFDINLIKFNKNIVDPIKLTFDSLVYKRGIKDLIKQECTRQFDKSNTNQIGYFHQNIFKYISTDWQVPNNGYDVINEQKQIYGEIKNKHNTMNSSSSAKTYMKMQSTIMNNNSAKCYLIEVLAKRSQDKPWKVSIENESFSDKRIRRISMDKFYELVTGDSFAFKKLCEVLPCVIQDVLKSHKCLKMNNTVFKELEKQSPDILTSLYLVSFATYEGFKDFNVRTN